MRNGFGCLELRVAYRLIFKTTSSLYKQFPVMNQMTSLCCASHWHFGKATVYIDCYRRWLQASCILGLHHWEQYTFLTRLLQERWTRREPVGKGRWAAWLISDTVLMTAVGYLWQQASMTALLCITHNTNIRRNGREAAGLLLDG